MMSPATLGASPGMTIRARAWMLDAVLDVDSHPHLINANNHETEISHEYVKRIFQRCDLHRANTLNTM
jgi:hypothetical protein